MDLAGELRRLKALVVNAKENGIKIVSVLIKKMLEKNAFLFGFVNINDYSEKERIKELVDVQNACIKKMHEKYVRHSCYALTIIATSASSMVSSCCFSFL